MNTIVAVVTDPLMIPGLLTLLGLAFAYRDRHTLQIGPFDIGEGEVPAAYKGLKSQLLAEMRQIIQIHQKLDAAAGELSLARDVSLAAHTEAIDIDAALARHATKRLALLELLLSLFRYLVRPPRLRGEIIAAGDSISITTTLHSRNSVPRQLPTIDLDSLDGRRIREAARKLALMVILERSGQREIRSIEAFGYFTDALARLPKLTINSSTDEAFAAVQELLERALDVEKSPFIYYNLGLVHYYRYGAGGNDQAIRMFDRATRTSHDRLAYLSRIALARCLCQNYHRLGSQSEKQRDRARRTAAEALDRVREARAVADEADLRRLRYDEGYALYAVAFSWHVTELPEDIDRGIELYERAIELLGEDTPAVIYNNLGYILMARAGRFDPTPGQEERYDRAVEVFERALVREGSYKFTLANLGNVERLRGNFDQALLRYEEALEVDPGYANGHNEMAWVHLYMGNEEEARRNHERARQLAGNDAHRAEIMEEYAYVLHGMGRVDEALGIAREAWKLNDQNHDLREWLDRNDPVKA